MKQENIKTDLIIASKTNGIIMTITLRKYRV